MKMIFWLTGFLMMSLGCARIRVEAPKEAIKMDISMRLDIYQHVVKDIDNIEDMISGSSQQIQPANTQSRLWDYLLPYAYAQEGLGPEVEAAVSRRKHRRSELIGWEQKGVLGESSLGLVVIRASEGVDAPLKELVSLENNDRMLIYQLVSQKNNAPLEEVQRLYAKRLQDDAPSGTPIEVLSENSLKYEWIVKK